MKKYVTCLMAIALSATVSVAQPADKAETGSVRWMTFEQAVQKNAVEKKQIFIDVYTDWCGWCKVMDKNTFNEPQVAKLLNEKFYAVKFNAEQTEDVLFNGHTFKYVPYGSRGSHELAMALLNNQMSYPTVVFLDSDLTSATPIPGYRKPEEFHKFLQYFGDNNHKKGPNSWTDFEKSYTSPYPAATADGAPQGH